MIPIAPISNMVKIPDYKWLSWIITAALFIFIIRMIVKAKLDNIKIKQDILINDYILELYRNKDK